MITGKAKFTGPRTPILLHFNDKEIQEDAPFYPIPCPNGTVHTEPGTVCPFSKLFIWPRPQISGRNRDENFQTFPHNLISFFFFIFSKLGRDRRPHVHTRVCENLSPRCVCLSVPSRERIILVSIASGCWTYWGVGTKSVNRSSKAIDWSQLGCLRG